MQTPLTPVKGNLFRLGLVGASHRVLIARLFIANIDIEVDHVFISVLALRSKYEALRWVDCARVINKLYATHPRLSKIKDEALRKQCARVRRVMVSTPGYLSQLSQFLQCLDRVGTAGKFPLEYPVVVPPAVSSSTPNVYYLEVAEPIHG